VKNPVPAVRAINREQAIAKIVPLSHTHAKRIRVYRNVQKTAPKRGTTPKLRITPVMQGEIVKLYLGGHSLSEISRQTHRARQTVTKVCRGPDIQTMIREQREMLIAESHAWAESINFAVTHELDGRLAFKLAQLFGVIPSPPKKAAPVKPQNDCQGVDPWKVAAAKVLGAEAMRRASAMRLENDQLEKLAPREQVQSNPKSSRLFDNRD
jgi:hypothetical protein